MLEVRQSILVTCEDGAGKRPIGMFEKQLEFRSAFGNLPSKLPFLINLSGWKKVKHNTPFMQTIHGDDLCADEGRLFAATPLGCP